jgi:hypothetical protein
MRRRRLLGAGVLRNASLLRSAMRLSCLVVLITSLPLAALGGEKDINKAASNVRQGEQEKRPIVRIHLKKLVVYRNGLVMEATIANQGDEAIRINTNTFPLLLRGISLEDKERNKWVISPLERHYQFEFNSSDNTSVIGAHERVTIELVDRLEWPTLKPKGKKAIEQHPTNLRYGINALFSLSRRQLEAPLLLVRLIGNGNTTIVWQDSEIPKKPNNVKK